MWLGQVIWTDDGVIERLISQNTFGEMICYGAISWWKRWPGTMKGQNILTLRIFWGIYPKLCKYLRDKIYLYITNARNRCIFILLIIIVLSRNNMGIWLKTNESND